MMQLGALEFGWPHFGFVLNLLIGWQKGMIYNTLCGDGKRILMSRYLT
jgi:hypothetical protein